MAQHCASCDSVIPDNETTCPNCGKSVGPLAAATKSSRMKWIVALTAFVVLASAAGAYALFSGGGDSILYQDANSIGPDPFMNASAFATVEPQTDLPGEPTKAPGLYGGSGDLGVCDAEAIITFLMQNADKRKAWAEVLGVPEDMIAEYIRTLRPVTLAQDTRITNHGFKNGKAYAFQAILQKGTAVLVDTNGKIVVKCYCGNPLTDPVDTDGECIGCPPGYTPPPPCEGLGCVETPPPGETPPPTPTPCVDGAVPCGDDVTPPPPPRTPTPEPTILKTAEPQPTPVPDAPAPTSTPAPTPCDPNTAPNGCTRF
jgi:hypothetical protein